LKKIIKEYGFLLVVAGFVITIDQITKAIVRANIPFGEQWMPLEWLAPYFRFVNWNNTGAAFGLFQSGGMVFAVLAVIISVSIVIYYPRISREEKLMRFAIALQLGGALGNLIDRILSGPVTDFISVGEFPVFNVADSCITIGVGLLILSMWISERREKNKNMELDELKQEEVNSIEKNS
jgi:signal peptidase II